MDEENQVIEQEGKPIGYKIMTGQELYVFRNEYAGTTYYKVKLSKKNYDGTKSTCYKNIRFKKGVDIPNGTKIKVLGGFEDFYVPPQDKFHPVFSVFITDFVVTEESNEVVKQALDDYNSSAYEYDENSLPF